MRKDAGREDRPATHEHTFCLATLLPLLPHLGLREGLVQELLEVRLVLLLLLADSVPLQLERFVTIIEESLATTEPRDRVARLLVLLEDASRPVQRRCDRKRL